MKSIPEIAASQPVRDAMQKISQSADSTIDLAIEIQQIPSPTFNEDQLARFVEEKFLEIGLEEIQRDRINNTFGKFPGSNPEKAIVISAHMDTIFPLETDLTISYGENVNGGKELIFGPGLADNSLGVAGLIVLAQILKDFDLEMQDDIWFVANVGEEGLGDLRGMRAVVDRFGSEASYIVLEGGSFGHIFHEAIGVRRFEIVVKTDGGHSWGDYGCKNAIHELSKIIAELTKIELPREPKTTLNVGLIKGGLTVNTIAAEAECQLDLRSSSASELDKIVAIVREIVNKVKQFPEIEVNMTEIGNRPAGKVSTESKLVVLATKALEEVGCKKISYMEGSTDANIPLSLGYPAVCIGLANSANTHRLNEFLDPTHLVQGVNQLLLLTLALARSGE
jgi:acetylornithine deacetylase/succinyl-diaminopimelate desuccinylase-like protein